MTWTHLFDLATILSSASALFSWINHRWLKLPNTLGVAVEALKQQDAPNASYVNYCLRESESYVLVQIAANRRATPIPRSQH